MVPLNVRKDNLVQETHILSSKPFEYYLILIYTSMRESFLFLFMVPLYEQQNKKGQFGSQTIFKNT